MTCLQQAPGGQAAPLLQTLANLTARQQGSAVRFGPTDATDRQQDRQELAHELRGPARDHLDPGKAQTSSSPRATEM